MKHVESRLQIACVAWFRAQYASIWNLLFSVPNGGARSKTEGAILKAEGATRGVADLLLLVARGGFGALAIEMKTTSKKSDQSDEQIDWETAATQAGNKYVVVLLIPARTDTKYFHKYIYHNAAEIRFIEGRLRFGDSKQGAPFPSMIVVFRRNY